MASSRSMNAKAATVSRVLRAGGLMPLASSVSRNRQGVRVMPNGSSVRVGFDFDSPHAAYVARTSAIEILQAGGYVIEELTETGALLVGREAW